MARIAVGLMSGTSCDGISAVVVRFQGRTIRVLAHRTVPYPATLTSLLHHSAILPACTLSTLNIELGERFAAASTQLLSRAKISRHHVRIIGSHGHTIYHGPRDPIPSTLQLGAPAVIAHRTGIPVVADFRMRDVAAGGEGAPLMPYFDELVFGGGPVRALLNLGGIANVTVVGKRRRPLAFDTGPGNCLLDPLAQRISRGRLRYDRGGTLARHGRIDHRAVARMWRDPFFRRPPPKSTGRELFNDTWLTRMFGRRITRAQTDVLATLTYFTAWSIAESLRRFGPPRIQEVIVSGGGVRNRTVMRHLCACLAPIPVVSIERYGIPVQAKEPAAFALFALRASRGEINHLPKTTGAAQACVLGALTPGSR